MACCRACTVLRLPDIAHFKGKTSQVARDIDFQSLCSIDGHVIRPLEDQFAAAGNDGEHRTRFCTKCDFCALVFDAVTIRHGSEISTAEARLRATVGLDWDKGGLQLVLDLPHLTFHAHTANRSVDGTVTEVKGISFIVLNGTFNLIHTSREQLSASVALSLPFEIYLDDHQGEASAGLSIYRWKTSPQALSPKSLSKIRDWLHDCKANHSRCSVVEDSGDGNGLQTITGRQLFLPTRLIHVGNPQHGENPKVVLTSKEFSSRAIDEESVRYLALSYCWGSVSERQGHLLSTSDTIEARQKAIPWKALPTAFQDVMLLAIELGVSYVWIDSLCILQGEGGDWNKESAMMWSIFANAFITVISAAASSPHTGFLNRSQSRSCIVSFPAASAASYSLQHRPGKKFWGVDRMAEISSNKWISRGWTYQEERLARRVLMFGENKFFFDCRLKEQVEDSDMWYWRPSWSKIIYSQLPGSSSAETVRSSKAEIFNHWQWLCVQYSHRTLTYPEDKLPAFSGVAAAVHAKVRTRYLAGMWEENLMHDLLWECHGETTKPRKYRAPSWSWVNLQSERVNWTNLPTCTDGTCKLYCHALEAETFLDSAESPFGAVTGGHVRLKGHLLPIKLDWEPEHKLPNRQCSVIFQDHWAAKAKLDLSDIAADTRTKGNVFALPIATCGKGNSNTRGLVLEKVRRRDGVEIYERIGKFSIHAWTKSEFNLRLARWTDVESTLVMIE